MNIKLNEAKCHFRYTSGSVFDEVISRHGVQPDPHKLKVLTDMPPPKTKKELQAFLGIINYLSKFCPSTVEVCKSLRKLTSAKTEWIWNATYQKMYQISHSVIESIWKVLSETELLLNQFGRFSLKQREPSKLIPEDV